MAGAKWRHPAPSGIGSNGVGKGFLGLVHLDKAFEWVVPESINGESISNVGNKDNIGISGVRSRTWPSMAAPGHGEKCSWEGGSYWRSLMANL